MKLRAVFLLIIVNLTLAMVSPGRKANKHYECKFSDIPITVGDVQTMALPFAPVKDQYEATDVLNTMTSQTQPGNAPQMVNISSIYNIRTQYCFPIGQKPSTTLQILTHGIGFNGTFWDFHPSSTPSDERYSYISAFTAAAYSTLSYNRLGISGSTLADPDKEVQTTVALAVLASPCTKVLPSLGDEHKFLIASIADPTRFPPSQYANGYVTWPSQWSNQYSFLAYPNFDNAILEQAEATKQSFPIAELVSMSLLRLDAPKFKGPVLYVNGGMDLIMCASNCTGMIQAGSDAFNAFKGTSDIESEIIGGAGHALHYHHSVQETYGKIVHWTKRHGF